MPEASGGLNESPHLQEPISPLSPEAYRDYSVQRKMVGYFSTGDTIVFKQSDFDATQAQATVYSKDLKDGKISAERVSEMLKFLPDGFSEYDPLVSSARFAMELSQDYLMGSQMAFLAGKRYEDLAPADIAKFFEKYPTPVELGDKLEEYVQSYENAFSDPESKLEASLAARRLLDALYGERQVYYQNYRLMLDRAQEGSLKKKPLVLKKPSRSKKVAGILPSVALGIATTYGGTSIAVDFMKDGRVDGPFAGETYRDREESQLENTVEEKFEIEILDVREAFRKRGWNFDIYNKEVLGNHPPTRWSEDQIQLLSKLLSKLPSSFYGPQGEVLNFSLTDYGENCPCAGTFHENFPNMRSAMVMLSDSNFRTENEDWAFRLLTHELAHRVDIDVLDKALWPKVNNILGFDNFSEARAKYFPKLEEVSRSIPGLDSTMARLNYGFMGIDKNGLNDPTELIAVLAEIYVGGPDEFKQIGAFLGEEVSDNLYILIKNEMFGGKVYVPEEIISDSPEVEAQFSEYEMKGFELADKLSKKFGVLVGDNSQFAWEQDSSDVFAKVLSLIPESFYDNGEGREKLQVVLGKVTKFEDNTLTVGVDYLLNQRLAFTEIGKHLAQRSEAYVSSKALFVEAIGKKRLLNDPNLSEFILSSADFSIYDNFNNLDDDQKIDVLFKEVIAMYMWGEDSFNNLVKLYNNFEVDGVKVNQDKKINPKELYLSIRDQLFEGDEYFQNDEGDIRKRNSSNLE